MPELYRIILTSAITILGGIFIYTGGQIIAKFFIEPIHEQFKLIGKIADSLIFYANLYCNPGNDEPEKRKEACNVFRQQASQLMARTYAIRWYKFWEYFRVVHKNVNIIGASKNLIGLSNSIYTINSDLIQGMINRNITRRKTIETLLGIKTSLE